jgi:hypothetical protein
MSWEAKKLNRRADIENQCTLLSSQFCIRASGVAWLSVSCTVLSTQRTKTAFRMHT